LAAGGLDNRSPPNRKIALFVRSFVVATMFYPRRFETERPARRISTSLWQRMGARDLAKSPGSNAAIAGINEFLCRDG